MAISVEADVVAVWRLPRFARNDREKGLEMAEERACNDRKNDLTFRCRLPSGGPSR